MILSPYSGFIGRDHFKSIVKLLGYSGIAWTVKECVLETCKSLIQNTIHLYLQNFKVKYFFVIGALLTFLESISRVDKNAKGRLWDRWCLSILPESPSRLSFVSRKVSSYSLLPRSWKRPRFRHDARAGFESRGNVRHAPVSSIQKTAAKVSRETR